MCSVCSVIFQPVSMPVHFIVYRSGKSIVYSIQLRNAIGITNYYNRNECLLQVNPFVFSLIVFLVSIYYGRLDRNEKERAHTAHSFFCRVFAFIYLCSFQFYRPPLILADGSSPHIQRKIQTQYRDSSRLSIDNKIYILRPLYELANTRAHLHGYF